MKTGALLLLRPCSSQQSLLAPMSCTVGVGLQSDTQAQNHGLCGCKIPACVYKWLSPEHQSFPATADGNICLLSSVPEQFYGGFLLFWAQSLLLP